MGIGKYLKEKNKNIKVYPLEPANSPTLSTGTHTSEHRIQGISDEFVPPILDLASLIEGDYSDPAKVFIAQALLQEDEIYKAQYADKKELTSKVEELKSEFKNQFKVE